MEKILHQGRLVAIKIDSMPEGSVPVTSPEEALQVLTLKHKKGRVTAAHSHTPRHRETMMLQECFTVIRGRLGVSFLDDTGNTFKQIEVGQGETCLILSGIHEVVFLEDSEVVETKNGPFIDDKKFLIS